MKNILVALILIISFTAFANNGNKTPFEKKFDHTFNVNSNTIVDLSNKFGKIDLKTWDKPEVYIKVTITVDAKSQEKAQSIFDRITVDFKESSDRVSAKTNISKRSSGWGSMFSNNSSEEYSIDWEVFMPSTNNLELTNKYGNTFITEMHSELDIDIAYGDIKMVGTTKHLELEVAYGGGSVDNLLTGDATVMYGSLNIGFVGNAKVKVQYSEIDVDDWGTGSLDVSYGTLRMNNLKGNIDIDLAYSDGVISNIETTTTKIDIDIAYGDIKIKTNGTPFYGDFDSTYGGISLPSSFQTTREKVGSFSSSYDGFTNGDRKGVEINGDVAYGDLVIK